MTELRASAEGGDVESQYRLGVLHRSDRYTSTSTKGLAAEAYYGFLPEDVGTLWVPPDDEEAQYWLSRAAEQGHAPAQVQLAGLLLKEDKGPSDPLMAYVWFSRAADRIRPNRRKEVLDLRSGIEDGLSAYERDEARRLIREWSPRIER